jgi:hypothetical protein
MSAVTAAIITAAATAGTGIYAATKSSGAAKDAAAAQTSAANYAADTQAKAAADTLDFTKQQAAQTRADAETTQRANYDQWVAAQQYQNATAASRANNINALGAQYGVGPRAVPVMNIPAYQPLGPAVAAPGATPPGATPPGTAPAGGPGATPPGVAPTVAASAAPGATLGAAALPPTGGAGAAPAVSAAKGDIGQQVSQYFKSRGVSDAETPYWVQKWAEFGATDPAYFNTRLAAADIFGGGGGAGGGASAAPATIKAALAAAPVGASTPSTTPIYTPPVTPGLTVQPYQRRTIADYLA